MEKLSKWIIAHQKLLLCIIILLIALSVIGSVFVKKNGDVISYLDKDTDAILGKTLLEQEFGIIGDANIAISYLQKDDIAKIVNKINVSAKVNACLSKLVWVGTFDDLSLLEQLGDTSIDPEDIAKTQEKAKQKFLKVTQQDEKNVNTFIISVYFNVASSDKIVIKALDEIDKIITKYIDEKIDNGALEFKYSKANDYYYIGGNAQNARSLVKSSLGDMPIFISVAVIICFIILLLTTKSYIEPIIFLLTLGVSILLNMGTNLIAGIPIGTISSITSSCSIILQLALAMDYSIFFMHTYYEEKKLTLDTRQAITKALPKTIVSISSSALTTVGGFVALFFMKYKMGYDLGFVLAKGVLLSLLSVVFLQPLLISMLDKPIEKCKHKWQLECRLRPLSKHITKPWLAIIIIVACVGIAIPSAYFQTKVPLNYITMTKENPNPNLSEQIVAQSENQLILLVPYNSSDIVKHQKFIEDLKLVGNKSDQNSVYTKDENGNFVKDNNLCNVTEVFSLFTVVDEKFYNDIESSPYKKIIYSKLHSSFISHINDTSTQNYMLYTVNLSGAPEDIESYNTVDELKKLCTNYFGADTSRITGITVGAKELNAITPTDFIIVNCVSAGLILLVLIFTFRKFFLSVMLLFVIETGIFANLSLVIVLGNLMPMLFDVKINFLAYLIVSAIELGATVDYAIMMTSKFLEEKKNGASSQTAVKNAIYRSA
ncbi:MAG: MMPL family transporter, partial [Clostridia bacterium]